MKIEVLGPGCAKCQTLVGNAETAVRELGLDCEVIKIRDIEEIIQRGVMMTPALIVDGTVKTVGKVTSVNEIKSLLNELQEL
jgi:small redox-active disulfide protein 2